MQIHVDRDELSSIIIRCPYFLLRNRQTASRKGEQNQWFFHVHVSIFNTQLC